MTTRTELHRPDISDRPHKLVVEREMKASPSVVYRAWTEEFDSWFASPGEIRMRPAKDEPFYFETSHEGGRHPHYGRFVTLERDRFIELTWMTGDPGTRGAETVVSVELDPSEAGTHLRLTHAGFYDEAGVKQHEAWADILAKLDDRLA
jgi:uncharacterized protein YndB with AHSA1/START domain